MLSVSDMFIIFGKIGGFCKVFPAIPNNQLIHNPEGVDFKDIITRLDSRYMTILSITYQNRKNSNSFTNLFKFPETHESRTEQLLVHCCDIRIASRKDD